MRNFLLFFVLNLIVMGCLPGQFGTSKQREAAAEPTDEVLRLNYGDQIASGVAEIRSKRQAALAAPQSFEAADAYADALIAGLKANYGRIQRIDWKQYLRDGADTLGTATTGREEDAEGTANALVKRATFQIALGDAGGGANTIRSAFARAHTFLSGLGMVQIDIADKKLGDAKILCAKTRPMAKSEDEVYELLHECLKLNQGEPPEQTLDWASEQDRTMYKGRREREIQKNLAHRHAEKEQDQRFRAEQADERDGPASPGRKRDSGHADSASNGPRRASFSLRSSCNHSVKVFFGKDPKYGSGRTSTISGNSVQNESMNEGEMLWIVDDSNNGISNFSASSATREVEINRSCSSFLVH